MKKGISVFLILAVILSSGIAIAQTHLPDYAGFPTARVTVNGVLIQTDVPAVIINGRTMVPIRFVSEAFEAEINWNQDTRTASINKPNSDAAFLNWLATNYNSERNRCFQFMGGNPSTATLDERKSAADCFHQLTLSLDSWSTTNDDLKMVQFNFIKAHSFAEAAVSVSDLNSATELLDAASELIIRAQESLAKF